MGKSYSLGLPYVLLVVSLFVNLVVSHIGFEGWTLVLIATVPFTFDSFSKLTTLSKI